VGGEGTLLGLERPLATAGGVVFYGTMDGYFKAVDAKTGSELYKFKTPSGIIGNVSTYSHGGKQYVAVLSGVGGWAAIGMAAGLTGANEGWARSAPIAACRNIPIWAGRSPCSRFPKRTRARTCRGEARRFLPGPFPNKNTTIGRSR
jgi:hypothetical protein